MFSKTPWKLCVTVSQNRIDESAHRLCFFHNKFIEILHPVLFFYFLDFFYLVYAYGCFVCMYICITEEGL